MKIGILGPMDLKVINVGNLGVELPEVYSFPLISHLVNGILEHGHEVVAYVLSSSIKEQVVIKGKNITICVAKSYLKPGRRLFKEEIRGLVDLIKETPPDILHAHWTYEFAWAAIKSNIPHVVSIHDVASVILKNQFDPYRIIRWYMNWVTLNKAKHLIANSNYTYSTLSRSEKEKTEIINNFYPSGLEQVVNSANKGNYIITVSNAFDKRKNIQTSLKAFSLIRNQLPHIKYYLVGNEMEDGGKAYQYAVKNDLHQQVIFMGGKEYSEIINLISNALIMVHPAKEESFGMTVLESMVIGTPVVGGKDSGNIPYMLKNEETGMTCNVNDPEDIASTVVKLIGDQKLYADIQKNGREYAEKEFSQKLSVAKHIEYYNSVLAKEKTNNDSENISLLKEKV